MSLLHLPTEVQLLVANLLEEERDINSLARINREFYSLLNPYLYRRNLLNSRRSALLWAASRGREATVRICVSEAANIGTIDYILPLFRAAKFGHEGVVKLLLETGRVDVDSKDFFRRTPLPIAVLREHEAVVKLLLATGRVNVDSKDTDDRTPLSFAAGGGRKAVVKLLLETRRVDINSKCSLGRTPLSWAAFWGHEAVVRLLLETEGLDVDSNSDGHTPLSFAVERGHEAVVKLLQETGRTNVDAKDPFARRDRVLRRREVDRLPTVA